MKRSLLFYFIIALGIVSCSDDFSANPDLIGQWKTPGAIYTFKEGEKYSINYIHSGGPGTPVADSIFGTFINDNKRSTITFQQEGMRIDSSQVIQYQALNGGVWEYEISGDDLTYESKTQTGALKRVTTTE